MNIHIHRLQGGGAVADEAALEQFQKQWATYQKLVDSDALSHKAVGIILHETLKLIAKPFAFLDIACGDAGQMKRALHATKVNHYHGIDLSEPALELAARKLSGVTFEVELDHRDFVDADQAPRARGRRLVRALDPSPRHRRQARSAWSDPKLDEQDADDLRAELGRGRGPRGLFAEIPQGESPRLAVPHHG